MDHIVHLFIPIVQCAMLMGVSLMDRLSSVLSRFSLNASVFFTGNLCGISSFGQTQSACGHLHLLKAGELKVIDDRGESHIFNEPTVIYFPRSMSHQLQSNEDEGVDLVCAEIDYQTSLNNPLAGAIPRIVSAPLLDGDRLGQTALWLFDEAFNERSGREHMIDRLCDIFLLCLLRKLLLEGSIEQGMMAGLAHPKISKALIEIHERPEDNWSLVAMAEKAGMSRSKFADVFRDVVGQTPLDYLTDWRISVAQKLILSKQNIDFVANQVGYENSSTFARVYRKKTGLSPKQWLKQNS